MRFMLEDGISAPDAVDRAVFSRAARHASASRPPVDVAIDSILAGKNDVYVGGKRISNSTRRIIRSY